MTASQGPTAHADPVRGLMRQHRELCEHAVDPLEIAAGLEASGVTDRTAARFRHRDVFSLAEELYARVPHADQRGLGERPVAGAPTRGRTGSGRAMGEGAVGGVRGDGARGDGVRGDGESVRVRSPRARRLVWPLVPGALCLATLGLLALVRGTPPYARCAVALVGIVAVCAGVRLTLRALPRSKSLALATGWLAAFAVFGDWLLGEVLGGGPDMPALPHPAPPEVALTLALGVAPALWCARAFSLGALRRLGGSRSLEEFAAGVRPLLAGAVALFTGCLLGLQWALWWVLQWGLPSATRWASAHPWGSGRAGGALDGVSGAAGAPGVAAGLAPGAFAATTCLGVLLFTALLLTAHGFRGAAAAGLAAACAVELAALACVLAARLPGLAPLGLPVERAVATLGTPAVPLTACVCAGLALLAYAFPALTCASAHHRVMEPT